MSRKSKRRSRREPGLRRRCLEAQHWEGDVRGAALDSGLSLRVNVVRCGGIGLTLHWMFDDVLTGNRVLDYWPSRGRWYSPGTRQTGEATDWWAALDEAQRQGCLIARGRGAVTVETSASPEARFAGHQQIAHRVAAAACRRGRFPRHDLGAALTATLWGLWKSAQKWDGRGSFAGYAAQCCRRALSDWMREEYGTRRKCPIRTVGLEDVRDRTGKPLDPQDPAPAASECREAAEALGVAIGRMPAGRVEVLRLLASGLKQFEVARALCLHVSTVSGLYRECLPLLRRELELLAGGRSAGTSLGRSRG